MKFLSSDFVVSYANILYENEVKKNRYDEDACTPNRLDPDSCLRGEKIFRILNDGAVKDFRYVP